MAHVQLRELVVAQVPHAVARGLELADDPGRLAAGAGEAQAHEDLRRRARRVAVIELGDVARAERGAEGEEGAALLGNLDRDQGLAMLADLGALADVAQPVEIEIRARVDRDETLAPAAPASLRMYWRPISPVASQSPDDGAPDPTFAGFVHAAAL